MPITRNTVSRATNVTTNHGLFSEDEARKANSLVMIPISILYISQPACALPGAFGFPECLIAIAISASAAKS
jgi:hypothetical protein